MTHFRWVAFRRWKLRWSNFLYVYILARVRRARRCAAVCVWIWCDHTLNFVIGTFHGVSDDAQVPSIEIPHGACVFTMCLFADVTRPRRIVFSRRGAWPMVAGPDKTRYLDWSAFRQIAKHDGTVRKKENLLRRGRCRTGSKWGRTTQANGHGTRSAQSEGCSGPRGRRTPWVGRSVS